MGKESVAGIRERTTPPSEAANRTNKIYTLIAQDPNLARDSTKTHSITSGGDVKNNIILVSPTQVGEQLRKSECH